MAEAPTKGRPGLEPAYEFLRPSYEIAEFLQAKGYRIVPVNPKETEVLGERAYATLADIPEDVDIDVVDVFRRAEFTPEIASMVSTISSRSPTTRAAPVWRCEDGALKVVRGIVRFPWHCGPEWFGRRACV